MIKRMRSQFPVPTLCKVLMVSQSGFYAWLSRTPSKRKQEDMKLAVEIMAAHKRTRGTFGAERLQQNMAAYGTHASLHRIKRIRQKLGIRCIQKKKYKATTNSRHRLPISPNLLNQNSAR